jgi:AcrR family transcriptional regulator
VPEGRRPAALYPRGVAELPEHLRARPATDRQLSPQVMARHRREGVLALVTPAFAKRGYPGISVEDLLAAGKIGAGYFYELFEGKEDCFSAACERAIGNARAAITEATRDVPEWADRAYLGLAAALEFLVAEPMQARLVLVEAQSAGPEATARYNALMDEAIAWLAEGRKAAGVKGLPKSFEQAAITGLAYYLQQCLVESRRHSASELLGETAGLLLEPILGAAEMRRLSREHAAAVPA